MTGADLRPTVVVVGTYDTKREPLTILAGALEAEGCIVHRVDFGVAEHETECETTPGATRGAGGVDAGAAPWRRAGERRWTPWLAVSPCASASSGPPDTSTPWSTPGGSGAGTVFGASASSVPFGVPKVLVSTIVAGDTRGYLHGLDALLFYPVVDIEGDKRDPAERAHALSPGHGGAGTGRRE